MATSIPPHNLGEVAEGVIAYMKNPDITTEELMRYIQGPDFPTGGIVVNKDELRPFTRAAAERSASGEKWRWKRAKAAASIW